MARQSIWTSRLAALALFALVVTPATAQRGGGFGGGGGGQRSAAAQEPQIKPYADVITDKAVTAEGVFKTHRIGEKLYFEIPKDELNKDFLWVTEVADTPEGGYNGTATGDLVVQWQRVDDKILLRQMNFNNRAVDSEALELGIQHSNVPPIIESFNIAALSDDGAAVIDVTSLYTSNPPEFDVARRLRVGALDPSRSYLDKVKTFPTNIEVRSVMTFRQGTPPPTTNGPGRRFPGFGATNSGPSNTAVVNYSM
ncbi:MAG TPA: DUF5117 domain-containing protein, partial [Fimbriimonadaceae bacterium]|nr:DUF5117 domain-containing protein [Fimbriimonadaceae bacterium]